MLQSIAKWVAMLSVCTALNANAESAMTDEEFDKLLEEASDAFYAEMAQTRTLSDEALAELNAFDARYQAIEQKAPGYRENEMVRFVQEVIAWRESKLSRASGEKMCDSIVNGYRNMSLKKLKDALQSYTQNPSLWDVLTKAYRNDSFDWSVLGPAKFCDFADG